MKEEEEEKKEALFLSIHFSKMLYCRKPASFLLSWQYNQYSVILHKLLFKKVSLCFMI